MTPTIQIPVASVMHQALGGNVALRGVAIVGSVGDVQATFSEESSGDTHEIIVPHRAVSCAHHAHFVCQCAWIDFPLRQQRLKTPSYWRQLVAQQARSYVRQ